MAEDEEIVLHSNSKYLTDAFNQGWTGEWERNGFRDSGGKRVQDEDHLEKTHSAGPEMEQ